MKTDFSGLTPEQRQAILVLLDQYQTFLQHQENGDKDIFERIRRKVANGESLAAGTEVNMFQTYIANVYDGEDGAPYYRYLRAFGLYKFRVDFALLNEKQRRQVIQHLQTCLENYRNRDDYLIAYKRLENMQRKVEEGASIGDKGVNDQQERYWLFRALNETYPFTSQDRRKEFKQHLWTLGLPLDGSV